MKINIEKRKNIINPNFEVVERKGVGHPDTVSDSLAEKISIEYSKYCLEHFGYVLHHNVDKVGVLGGLIDLNWQNSSLKQPIRVILDGRLSRSFGGEKIPVYEIAEKAIKEQIVKNLPNLNVEKDLEIVDFSTDYSKNPYWFNPRGVEDLPEYKMLFANDTSSVVSYWGLSPAESLALKLEGYFYKGIGIPKFDDIGQDIKVMIVKEFNNYDITLAVPFFANKLGNESRYWERIDEITEELTTFAMKELPEEAQITLNVNTQDQGKDRTVENNIKSFYLVAAGGALDYGEEGFVGRGNNRLGIISSGRPYTMEAAAGKNPVYHVGKVLGVVADGITKELSKQASGDFEVWLMARNGDPLLAPNKVIVNHNSEWDDEQIDKVVRSVLDKNDWTERILKEELLVPTPLITK